MHMPSSGYCPNNTSVPYTVLWRPCVCSHNLHYGEGLMLHHVLRGVILSCLDDGPGGWHLNSVVTCVTLGQEGWIVV